MLEVGTGARIPVGVPLQPDRQGLDDRNHRAALCADPQAIYDGLIAARLFANIRPSPPKQADGYYGWEEAAPFDKIIVTCGIDHVPPALLQQLEARRADGACRLGRPGAQHVLKVVKTGGGRRRFHGRPLRHLQRQGHSVRARSPAFQVTRFRVRIICSCAIGRQLSRRKPLPHKGVRRGPAALRREYPRAS